MMKYILITILIFTLSGCSLSQPPVTEYRVHTHLSISDAKVDGCKNKSLKVAQAFSSSSLMSRDMNYGQGASKQYVFSQSQWADSPNRSVTGEIIKMLRDSNFFQNVQISKSRSKSDLILETHIEDFQQYFNDDFTNSYANVLITFTIIDDKSSDVLASKTFKSRVDVKSLDSDGGVDSLNEALENVLTQSYEWIGGVCK